MLPRAVTRVGLLATFDSPTQDAPPNNGTNTEYDPLLEGQPVEHIKHVGRYVSSSRNAASQLGYTVAVLSQKLKDRSVRNFPLDFHGMKVLSLVLHLQQTK